ncbi:hypothetical protein KKH03_04775, partial [Patescibacteria group bacterium]|nr:hypothetical protein [Patescibacteria group bacterium]
ATEIDMGEEVTERTVEKKPRISGETKKEKKMKKTAATEKTPEEEKETFMSEFVVKADGNGEEPTDMDEGVIYKFED